MAFRWPPFKKKEEEVVREIKIRPGRKRKRPKLKRGAKIKKRKRGVEEKRISVSDLMTKNIISVSPFTNLEKVVQIFMDNKISGSPVLDKEFFIGEISKTDILNLVKKESLEDLTDEDRAILRGNRVAEFMKKPICIFYFKGADEARRKMEKYNIKRLMVLDKKNHLVGIISKTDILKGVSKEEVKKEIFTKIDEILRILEKEPADFNKLSKSLKIPENVVENWTKILEEHNLVEISYPPIGSPLVKLKTTKTSD